MATTYKARLCEAGLLADCWHPGCTACPARPTRGEEVGSVVLELTVAAEQHFDAVMEVIRDDLKVIELAERYWVSRQTVHSWLRTIPLAAGRAR
jgi:hypothetical protein